jgi:hypothetical protein
LHNKLKEYGSSQQDAETVKSEESGQ